MFRSHILKSLKYASYTFFVIVYFTKQFRYLITGKPAKLSSYLDPNMYSASKAVDGLYLSGYASMAHSLLEYRPWWRVDLIDICCVWAVNILNRGISEFCC